MDLREQLRRRSRDNRWIFGGLSALLIVLSGLYYLLLRGRGLSPATLNNKVLLFALGYVNIILILVVLFVLVRSFFRLLIERRSKFKTKLVLTAVALSLIPVLILFPIATGLVDESFDQWLSQPLERLVTEAEEVSNALEDRIAEQNHRDAERVLRAILDLDPRDLGQQATLQRRLGELRDELGMDYLMVYDGTELVHGTTDPLTGFGRLPDVYRLSRFLDQAIREGGAKRFERDLGIPGQLILAARAAARTAEGAEPGSTVVVTGTLLSPSLSGKIQSIRQAYQSHLRLTVQKEGIRERYRLVLLTVTLLVILAFSSIGLRLARRVTEPIQALAEGTRRISQGQLEHRVRVPVDDELAVLVDAFNRMAADLENNRALVERRNRELVVANDRLAAVLENVAAGVVAIDAEGIILTCNVAALQILRQAEHEVLGKHLRQAWDDPARGELADLLEEDVATGHEIEAQRRLTLGGAWRTLEVKVKRLPDAKGQEGGRVVVLEDLTELIQAQKMAAWNEVARRIAHEIKNPLTPIRLAAERLLKKHAQGEAGFGEILRNGVEVIVREVSSLKNMVDEFSRFARMPRPQPQRVDLEKLFGETLRLYREIKPGVVVEGRVGEGAGFVWFDAEQLRGALVNLLDNALEATEAPGSVELDARRQEGMVLLRVSDTGHGIPEEELDKVFLPYFSTKGRGSGLGLAIVHRVVHDNNAMIRAESRVPQGSIFTVEIPAAEG